MRKIILIAALAAVSLFGYSQDGNNICVWNAMNTFEGGGSASDLEGGIKCSDLAAAHESTVGKSKTWAYRGKLYTMVFQNKELKEKYPTAAFEATKAAKRLLELNDPKFKAGDWEEVSKWLVPLETDMFNRGVDYYQQKNFAQAFQFFYGIKEADTVLTAKKIKTNIDLTTALKNAAICAENAKDMKGAIAVYKEWLAISPDSLGYRSYAAALKNSGQKAEAAKIIDEGIAKYPRDPNLLVEKINIFLEDTQYVAALKYINNLLEVDPKNDGALFIKGLAYSKIGNEDSVIYYYTKTGEVNPKNVKPWNNLAALYVDKANALVEPLNKLGNSAADLKKVDELQAQMKAHYSKAVPYLEKVIAIEPCDASATRTLNQIILKTGLKASTTACPDKLTLTNYNKIADGMSYDQVRGILGFSDGQPTVTGKEAAYTWNDKKGGSIAITLTDDKVTSRTQTGLK